MTNDLLSEAQIDEIAELIRRRVKPIKADTANRIDYALDQAKLALKYKAQRDALNELIKGSGWDEYPKNDFTEETRRRAQNELIEKLKTQAQKIMEDK
jgi:hypothetical protein